MRLTAMENSAFVEIDTGHAAIGPLRLSAPEGIATNEGFSSVYPRGRWAGGPSELTQSVPVEDTCGGGNIPKISDEWFTFEDMRIPGSSAVEWQTRVTAAADAVHFRIRLRNVGTKRLHKAGAAVCCRFVAAPWWRDDAVFVRSGGRVVPLSSLGMGGGAPNQYQAYLVAGQTYDNIFYRDYWGFNAARLDRPAMVSWCRATGLCVGIESPRAVFLHCNRGNPCTDILPAFGDVEPGATAEAEGTVWVRPGRPEDFPA